MRWSSVRNRCKWLVALGETHNRLSIRGSRTRTFRSALRPAATRPTAPAGAASGPGTQDGYWAELCSKLVAQVGRSSSYRALV